jgi:hypothetical protein
MAMMRIDDLNVALADGGGFAPMQEFPGWNLRWTGWKTAMDHVMLAAQWVAVSASQTYAFCSSTPGEARKYSRGERFDIMPQPGQLFLSMEDFDRLTDEGLIAHAQEVKLQAKARLLEVMERELRTPRPGLVALADFTNEHGHFKLHSETGNYYSGSGPADPKAKWVDKFGRNITREQVMSDWIAAGLTAAASDTHKQVMQDFYTQQRDDWREYQEKSRRVVEPTVEQVAREWEKKRGQAVELAETPPQPIKLMKCPTCGPRPWATAPPLDSRDLVCPNCGRRDLERI